jgi:hypothetical protein
MKAPYMASNYDVVKTESSYMVILLEPFTPDLSPVDNITVGQLIASFYLEENAKEYVKLIGGHLNESNSQ